MKFRKKIPVTLVGGFLGAGKTTLLNHRVSSGELRYGVVVNEFGDVGVDSGMIERLDSEGVAELDGGCLCCVGNEDLMGALYGTLTREEPPEHLLIELSGLADPVPVAQAIVASELSGMLELDGIVAVADARNLEQTLRENPEGRAQLAYATVVVLNKRDLVDRDTLERAEGLVRELNPLARVLRASHAAVDREDVVGLRALDPDWSLPGHLPRHSPDVSAVTLRSERPLRPDRWSRFRDRMLTGSPGSVYRAKGVLRFEGAGPMLFQSVREISTLSPHDGDAGAGSELVVIGRDLDEDRYREAFEKVLVPYGA
ncbi:MAG: GTP-binding protein [Rubrobacter sp.]|nr:GTP-binding protein [Rubrobacter sp.]